MHILIKTNRRGHISFNHLSEQYHINFGNVLMKLDFIQLKKFEKVVEGIDIDNYKNEIDINTFEPFSNNMQLTADELFDLKDLLGVNNSAKPEKINVCFSVN